MELVVEQKERLGVKNHHVVIRKRTKHEEGRMEELEFFDLKKQCKKVVLSSILHASFFMLVL